MTKDGMVQWYERNRDLPEDVIDWVFANPEVIEEFNVRALAEGWDPSLAERMRIGRDRVIIPRQDDFMRWAEDQGFDPKPVWSWQERHPAEWERVELVQEAMHQLALEPRGPARVELLMAYYWDRQTYAQMAKERRITRQAVTKQVRTAERHLARHIIALTRADAERLPPAPI